MDKPRFSRNQPRVPGEEYAHDEIFDHALRVAEDRRDNTVRWGNLPVVGQNVVNVTTGETQAFRQEESYLLDPCHRLTGRILAPASRGLGRDPR